MWTHKEIICHLEFSNVGQVVSVQKMCPGSPTPLGYSVEGKGLYFLKFCAQCKQVPLDPKKENTKAVWGASVCVNSELSL